MNQIFPQKPPLTVLTIYIQDMYSCFEDWMDGEPPYFLSVKNIQPEDFLNFDFFQYTIEQLFLEQQETGQIESDIKQIHEELLKQIKNGDKDISFEINVADGDFAYHFNFITI